jgi:hypothetical protein
MNFPQQARNIRAQLSQTAALSVGFEVFTAVTRKNAVILDVTPYGFVRTAATLESIASI